MLEHNIRTLCTVQLALNRVKQGLKRRILCAQNRERMPLGQCVDIIRVH